MSAPPVFLTCCTISHVSQALLALRSARQFNPDFSYYMFVADATQDALDQIRDILVAEFSWLTLFGVEDLNIFKDQYLRCFDYYNAFEVSNIAKYVGLAEAGARTGASKVVFSDSDTFYLNDLGSLLEVADNPAVILTPHQLSPTSEEVEHDHLLHGWLNSGFSIFDFAHDHTSRILDWLMARVSKRGYLATPYGLSGDQPWISGLPFVFGESVGICRDPR